MNMGFNREPRRIGQLVRTITRLMTNLKMRRKVGQPLSTLCHLAPRSPAATLIRSRMDSGSASIGDKMHQHALRAGA